MPEIPSEPRREGQAFAATDAPPPRRIQFSLRTLLWTVTAVCVIAGEVANGDDSWHFNVYGSLVMLHGLVLTGAYVAWTARPPNRRALLVVAATAAAAAFIPFVPHQGYSLSAAVSEVEIVSALLCWPSAWLAWRVLRRAPSDFDGPAIRAAALCSLSGGGLLFCYATLILYSHWHRLEPRFDVTDAPIPATWVAGGGSLAAAIPWIVLLRRRARGTATNRGWIDRAAQVFLAAGVAIALLGWVIVMYLLIIRGPKDNFLGFIGIVLALLWLCGVPQVLSAGLFLLGLTIELCRDRWHPNLTAAGCVHFVPFWLTIAYDPYLIFWPFYC